MKILSFFIIIFAAIHTFAQQSNDEKLNELFDKGEFKEILTLSEKIPVDELNANSLYIIGIANYDNGIYLNAIKYLEDAIKKGPEESRMYYFIIQSYKELEKYEKALGITEKTIEKFPDKKTYPTEKCEILMMLGKKSEAVEMLKNLIDENKTVGKTFYLLGNYYYNDLKDNSSALKVLYRGKENTEKDDEYYVHILYNIYLIEFDNENYTESINYIRELLTYQPQNYKIYPQCIQNYFALQQYDSAAVYQKVLYDAKNNNKLKSKLEKEYCFERFKWQGSWVYAYEDYYQPNPDKDFAFHKHTYVVLDSSWKEKFTVQSELFNTFKPGDGITYVIGSGKYEDDVYYHQTYPIFLKDPVDYKKLKEGIMAVLEGKVTPVTQSKSKKNK